MNRYPDQIIILEPVGGDPYTNPTWRQVYTGRCRCFLDRQAAFRTNKVMDCTHQVVIPDRYMTEIGENFKVGVKMHTNKSSRDWDLIGFVKDFARYDRVCNLYFQMVKENIIYDDMPLPAIDPDNRTMNTYEDEYLKMESVGLIRDCILIENEILRVQCAQEGYMLKFLMQDDNGDWSEEEARFELPVLTDYYIDQDRVYVLVGYHIDDTSDVRPQPNTIRIEVYDLNDAFEPVYYKDLMVEE